MGTLDQVTQMKSQGMSEREIISKLQGQNISPKEITDALTQSEIKKAVSNPQEMQPSIMSQDFATAPTPMGEETYTPQTIYPLQPAQPSYPEPRTPLVMEENPYGGVEDQEYYSDETYGAGMQNSDFAIEVAEQVFSEKTKKINRQIKELNDFKTIYQTRIDEVNERLKRMEKMFDKLQLSILEKVGSYGRNLENIKNEMSMVEDSVSKMINPLLDKAHKK